MQGFFVLLLSFPRVLVTLLWGFLHDKLDMSRNEQAKKREGVSMVFKQFRGLPWGRIALFCGLPGPVSKKGPRAQCSLQRKEPRNGPNVVTCSPSSDWLLWGG